MIPFHNHTYYFSNIHFSPSIYVYILKEMSFNEVFCPKCCMHFLPVCSMPPPTLFNVNTTNCEVSHFLISSLFVLFSSEIKIYPTVICSQTYTVLCSFLTHQSQSCPLRILITSEITRGVTCNRK